MAKHDAIGSRFTSLLSTKYYTADDSIIPWKKNHRNMTFVDFQGYSSDI